MFWGYLSVHVRYLPNEFFFGGEGGGEIIYTYISFDISIEK